MMQRGVHLRRVIAVHLWVIREIQVDENDPLVVGFLVGRI
jgi:hypothetical protein